MNERPFEWLVWEGFLEEVTSTLRWELPEGASQARTKGNGPTKGLREEGACRVSKTQGAPCGPSTAGDREKEASPQLEDKGEMIQGVAHPGPGTEFILVVKRRHCRV